ncbi:MAG: tRNA epoxyqueuosine(34) reductase QueG [Pseudomonadota bacterium]
MSVLVRNLKEFARSIGFDRVGITSAEPPEHYPNYLDWLQRGFAADLRYLKRADRVAKRGDLGKVLDGARSVIVGAVSYAPRAGDTLPGCPPRTDARFARYGWGADYHKAVKERLEILAGWIASRVQKDFRYVAHVDTGPVMERSLARRAGVGWVGKNALVMSEETGSYIVLGELVTTLDLPNDTPATDRCGTCTKCIDACPTQALVEPYLLDANRCISYQTIENRRGPLPSAVSEKLSGWVAGCDACQEVCPWNLEPVSHRLEIFSPRPHSGLSLDQLIALTPEGFSRWFRGTAFHRVGWATIVRNAKSAYLSGRSGP